MHFDSAASLARRVREKELSAEQLSQYYLARIEQHNPSINAYVEVFKEEALSIARACDKALSQAEPLGLLHGVPVSIKESFKMLGTPSRLNFPLMKNYQADSNSILVQRLIDAGAVILGKTNVPTLLADIQTFGPLYPTCNNPYDLGHTAGGSTGGAAALAAGLSALELGSDIGGSIRNPSSFCGLFGLKPTENGYANDGHIPPLPQSISGRSIGVSVLNNTGPLARSAEDLELAYQILFRPDWDNLRYLPIAREQKLSPELKDYRFAYFDSLQGISPSQELRQGLEKMLTKIQEQGASVERIQIPANLSERIFKVWATLFGTMIGQNLTWPIRKLFYWRFLKSINQSTLPVKRELKQGLSLSYLHFSRAMAERAELISEVNHMFAPYDAVLSPTAMGAAFEHNPKHETMLVDGQAVAYLDYCLPFVAFYNLSAQPVITLPAGLSDRTLPLGMSMAAKHHCEATLLQIAKNIEALGFGFVPPRAY